MEIEEGTVTMAKALEIDFEAPSSHKWVSTGGKPGRISEARQGENFQNGFYKVYAQVHLSVSISVEVVDRICFRPPIPPPLPPCEFL